MSNMLQKIFEFLFLRKKEIYITYQYSLSSGEAGMGNYALTMMYWFLTPCIDSTKDLPRIREALLPNILKSHPKITPGDIEGIIILNILTFPI